MEVEQMRNNLQAEDFKYIDETLIYTPLIYINDDPQCLYSVSTWEACLWGVAKGNTRIL